ncbi:hypothetical protein ACJMK2_020491 [Sinanodonta woodiana]|uniref:TNFR-Cys domain-containing protein n=1 Tax=Sinanodonta woodiana TaxID=1069815 RepID=A0ABD3U205_SINWO
MDPLHFHFFIWILCLSVVEGNSNISDDVTSINECRHCKPGHYASRMCSNEHDTICSPCPRGMFTSESNIANQCTACSHCNSEEYESEVCSKEKDTVCKSCDDFLIDRANERFLSECSKYLGLKSNNTSPDFYVGQSEIGKDSIEGSGTEGDGDPIYTDLNIHLFNDTELVLTNTTEEGSGGVLIVFPSQTELNQSFSVPLLSPKEEENGDLIPITTKEVTTAPKENDSYVITSPTARSLPTPQVKIQPEVVVILNTSHEKSIQLPNITTTESPSSNIRTTKRPIVQSNHGTGVLHEDLRKGGQPLIDKPVADASQNQESKSSEGNNVAVEVVIIIAVVAALVFFIIGFVVSKYCRRDHGTFNVLKAAKRNGLPSQDSTIEHKDPEINSGRGTSIYDEIPATEKQNGKTTETRPAEDNVYSKPVKRPESEVKVEPSGAREADNPETEPLTEIQYIDETSDDELERASQTDRLLPPVVSSNGSSSGSGNQPAEDDNQLTEETPMLNSSEPKQQPGSPAHEGLKKQNT